MRAPLAVLITFVCSCTSQPADTVLDLVFDPCEPVLLDAPGATAAQRTSIDDALAMWRAHGVTGPVSSGDPSLPRIELRFEDAAPAFHGLYDDETAVIFVNTALTDAHQRAVTIAHELGHALGMWHVADRISVMNPGNLEVEPTDGDQATLEQLWGACGTVGLIAPESPALR